MRLPDDCTGGAPSFSGGCQLQRASTLHYIWLWGGKVGAAFRKTVNTFLGFDEFSMGSDFILHSRICDPSISRNLLS